MKSDEVMILVQTGLFIYFVHIQREIDRCFSVGIISTQSLKWK